MRGAAPRRRGRDVLVEAEQLVRDVAPLDLREPVYPAPKLARTRCWSSAEVKVDVAAWF